VVDCSRHDVSPINVLLQILRSRLKKLRAQQKTGKNGTQDGMTDATNVELMRGTTERWEEPVHAAKALRQA
jgi:hypothetical protein